MFDYRARNEIQLQVSFDFLRVVQFSENQRSYKERNGSRATWVSRIHFVILLYLYYF